MGVVGVVMKIIINIIIIITGEARTTTRSSSRARLTMWGRLTLPAGPACRREVTGTTHRSRVTAVDQ